jgi:hypothetical protein
LLDKYFHFPQHACRNQNPAKNFCPSRDGQALAETDEPEFWRCLRRWESVRVKDRDKFLDALARWGFYKVKAVNGLLKNLLLFSQAS